MNVEKLFGAARACAFSFRNGLITATVALLALTHVAPTVQAATISTLFNTGVDASGTPLIDGTIGDPHYTLAFVPGGTFATLVRTSVGGFPIPPYLPDNTLSAWIGPNNAQELTGLGGGYAYETMFNLAGLDPSTVTITGRWSSDNAGLGIVLNGILTAASGNPYGSAGDYSYQHWVSFVISDGFQAGTNTLDFLILNGNGADDTDGPTALRVEMTAIVTPLPAALPLFAGGLGVIGFLARRRRTRMAAALAA